MKKRIVTLATLVGAVAPVVALAPKASRRRGDVPDLSSAVDACRASGRDGWELVGFATRLVNDTYEHYSAWHLWVSPDRSLERAQGLSLQYNQALAEVLRRLGFDVAVVQSARVRHETPRPWWLAGHVWLRVTIGAHTRDVCAGNGRNRPGDVDFVPVSDVRPFRAISHLGLCTLGVVPVTWTVWRSWITGDHVPAWLYRPFTH